jgi:hypothetical protein
MIVNVLSIKLLLLRALIFFLTSHVNGINPQARDLQLLLLQRAVFER